MSWREQLNVNELTVTKILSQDSGYGIDFSSADYDEDAVELTFQNGATIISNSETCGIVLTDAITAENDRVLNIDAEAQNLTKGARQGGLFIGFERPSDYAMTGWDGNPDCGLKIQAQNKAANTTARNAVRALDIQARNRSTNVWVKTMELNARCDSGGNTTEMSGLHIRMENYGTVDTSIIGLDIEMSVENDTSDPQTTAVLIRNTDQSAQNAIRDVFMISHTSTNGFTNLFYFNSTSGDCIQTNAADVSGTNTAWAIVVSVNGTPGYIPVYNTLSW